MSVTVSAAVSATLSAVYGSELASILSSEAGAPVLYPTGRPGRKDAEAFLQSFTLKANAAANAMGCGSVLLGQTSDTDEFGDLAFYLGDGDYGKSCKGSEVIKTLHLQPRLTEKSTIEIVDVLPDVPLPVSSCLRRSNEAEEAQELVQLLSLLSDTYCMRIANLGDNHNLVVYLLVARAPAGFNIPGWVGLLGAGIWS